jgi:hypothetical protein
MQYCNTYLNTCSWHTEDEAAVNVLAVVEAAQKAKKLTSYHEAG